MSLYAFCLIGVVFLVAFLMTGRLVSADFSLKFLDYPNDRSLHARPIPRTGGIAILSGIIIGFLLGLEGSSADTTTLWILSMTLFLGFLSFWDVRCGLHQSLRLISHFLAASGIVWGCGLKIQTLLVPILGTVSLGVLAVPVTLFIIVWMTNLYNFMDGMDGFSGGMSVFGFGFFGLLVLMSGGHHFLVVQSWTIAAASAGFLLYNFPPARIFMGDVGSIPIGFLAGVFMIRALVEGSCDIWALLLVFSPFIVDATITLLRRLMTKKRIWIAHREHYYQRIVMTGWGHLRTVLVEYALMFAGGLSALIYEKTTSNGQMIILMGWVVFYTIAAYSISRLEGKGHS